jgi:anthranilate phosphoribosyltransferase
MVSAMQEIVSGRATSVQIAGFLVALEMKGPSVKELTVATRFLRSIANTLTFKEPLTDIVGTGGDGACTFNISTTSAFVIAAAGGKVAKHGNRSVSSASGSADLLEHAGINLEQLFFHVKACIKTHGIGFLYAPHYHPALKQAAHARKELGIRTFLNLLGPLINPANASFLVIGVYDNKWLTPVANVLLNLGCERAMVVHSEDGLDEISIAAATSIAEVKHKHISYYSITPEQFGFQRQSIQPLQVQNAKESYRLMMDTLHNTNGPAKDIVLLNAGAAIYNMGLAETIQEGIEKSNQAIISGRALKKLNQLIAFSRNF